MSHPPENDDLRLARIRRASRDLSEPDAPDVSRAMLGYLASSVTGSDVFHGFNAAEVLGDESEGADPVFTVDTTHVQQAVVLGDSAGLAVGYHVLNYTSSRWIVGENSHAVTTCGLAVKVNMTDQATGDPIDGMSVTVRDTTASVDYAGSTDTSGDFTSSEFAQAHAFKVTWNPTHPPYTDSPTYGPCSHYFSYATDRDCDTEIDYAICYPHVTMSSGGVAGLRWTFQWRPDSAGTSALRATGVDGSTFTPPGNCTVLGPTVAGGWRDAIIGVTDGGDGLYTVDLCRIGEKGTWYCGTNNSSPGYYSVRDPLLYALSSGRYLGECKPFTFTCDDFTISASVTQVPDDYVYLCGSNGDTDGLPYCSLSTDNYDHRLYGGTALSQDYPDPSNPLIGTCIKKSLFITLYDGGNVGFGTTAGTPIAINWAGHAATDQYGSGLVSLWTSDTISGTFTLTGLHVCTYSSLKVSLKSTTSSPIPNYVECVFSGVSGTDCFSDPASKSSPLPYPPCSASSSSQHLAHPTVYSISPDDGPFSFEITE